MMTVNEVSKLTGVSVRALHYYDEIGLLPPSLTTDAGYRLYNVESLAKLQQILLFRELEFSLKDIKIIINTPGFDFIKALSDQVELLILKKERLENLISYAKQIIDQGEYIMNFKAFDNEKIENYKTETKKRWGGTEAYHEYEAKTADYSIEKQKTLASEMMSIFTDFGAMRNVAPNDAEVQKLVKKLQDFITGNYYTCTNEILLSLGQMYSAGGEMTDNIDSAGGNGTAEFAARAIAEYCKTN